MKNRSLKLLAISILVPGIVDALNCPLQSGTQFSVGAGFDAAYGLGDLTATTEALYSGTNAVGCTCKVYADDCAGQTVVQSQAYELNTYVRRSRTWEKSSYRYAYVEVNGGTAGSARADVWG
jgi:hypothetical protein